MYDDHHTTHIEGHLLIANMEAKRDKSPVRPYKSFLDGTWPTDSFQKLNSRKKFPQEIIFESFGNNIATINRLYQRCGCFTQWREYKEMETVMPFNCTFHDGSYQCLWEDNEQLEVATNQVRKTTHQVRQACQEQKRAWQKLKSIEETLFPK